MTPTTLPPLPDGWRWRERKSPVGRCRSCRAGIWWAITPGGKWNPLDADGTSHFATCPAAAEHRRPRQAAAGPRGILRDLGWLWRPLALGDVAHLVPGSLTRGSRAACGAAIGPVFPVDNEVERCAVCVAKDGPDA